MTEWFKQLSNPGRPSVAGLPVSGLHLAAFGKHPGWDDHIPGIGVDTEALAALKQALYFDGIRTQIDSGAWEKIDQLKRIEGFDHSFLWVRPSGVLLGLMWSSTDRIGRSKYPMILCADAEGFSPAFMAAYAMPELESLRDKCKAITSSEEVTAECHAALDRLKGIFERMQNGWVEPFSEIAERERFLNCAELAPNQTGFLRVLHEYSTEKGFASADKNTKHLRVPVIHNLQTDAFTPWVEFFKCVVPAKVPIFFIKRHGTEWLDVIIGQPDSRDFFCLQATTEALPLTTQVPYEISPAAKSALESVTTRLGLPAVSGKTSKAQTPVVSSATPRVQTGPKSAKSGASRFLFYGIIIVVILGVVALIILFKSKSPPTKGATTTKSTVTLSTEQAAAEGVRYQTAIQDATDAFAKGDYNQAIQQANIALAIEPGDTAAMQLKTDAENKKRDAESREMAYATAMAAGRNALAQKKYNEAIRQVKNALAINPGDSEAMALDNAVEAQQEVDAKARQEKYEEAMAAGRNALAKGHFEDAIGQANIALANEPEDAEAAQLKNGAAAQKKAMADAKVREQKYERAMAAGRSAFSNRNYDEAIRQANFARENKPGDADAKNLISQADAQLAMQQHEQQYESAVQSVQTAWARNDYNTVIQQAVQALAVRPDNEDIKMKLRDSVYNELDVYAVWFGVITPQKATSPFARTQSPLSGDITPREASAYKNQIVWWLKTLNQYQLLDDAHDKIAGQVEQNINRY